MIFKNIAKAAARLLDKEDVAAHFDEPSSSDAVRREAELVARCVNLCIAQTAAEYAPFRAEKVVESDGGLHFEYVLEFVSEGSERLVGISASSTSFTAKESLQVQSIALSRISIIDLQRKF